MTPKRTVKARRVDYAYGDGVERHFAGGDLLLSHLTALSSATFPEGEDFFVRSVRRYRDEITDPELKRQVGGFIGQEAMHGRQHRDFNARLGELGYPTALVDRQSKRGLGLLEKVAPAKVSLALTAALEHLTATFAELLLSTPELQEGYADPDVRNLWLWHALEESEHKAVAFDVYQQVCGDAKLRARVMRVLLVNIVASLVLGLAISLARDPAGRSPRRLRESWRNLKASPFASRELWDRIRDYERPDFHPDDHDTTALTEEWRQRLFGERLVASPA